MDHDQAAPVALTPQLLEVAAVDAALTEDQVASVAREGVALGLRAVLVRPSDLDQIARMAFGTTILAAACGYPDGSATTSAKMFEASDCLRRGAREIHVVPNIGKLNSRQFQYVEMELIQLARVCHESGTRLRMILQSPLLTEEARLVAAKIAKRSEVDSVIGALGELPADHLDMLLRKCPPLVQVAGHAESLDATLAGVSMGCSSIFTRHPAQILAEWSQRQALAQPAPSVA